MCTCGAVVFTDYQIHVKALTSLMLSVHYKYVLETYQRVFYFRILSQKCLTHCNIRFHLSLTLSSRLPLTEVGLNTMQ